MCLPLIDNLSNPAMRTRHWKQLVRVTGGAVQVDNDTLKRMTLGELLSLGLQSRLSGLHLVFLSFLTLASYGFTFIDSLGGVITPNTVFNFNH